MKTNTYRAILAALFVLLSVSYFFPWKLAYGSDSLALTWLGASSTLSHPTIDILSTIFTVAYAASYIGLAFFFRWSRALLLILTILGGLFIALFGISVQSSYEGMLGFFSTIGDGFLIGITFFSDLRVKFSQERNEE